MTTYHYSGPTRIARRTGACTVCGKRGSRQKTIEHTVNPFNRNPDGTVKTYSEVAADVRLEADRWSAVPFTHERCELPA